MSGPVEVKWFWRRWYTFIADTVGYGFLAAIIFKLTDNQALKWVALALIAASICRGLFYMAGATGTDIARVVAAARAGTAAPSSGDQTQ